MLTVISKELPEYMSGAFSQAAGVLVQCQVLGRATERYKLSDDAGAVRFVFQRTPYSIDGVPKQGVHVESVTLPANGSAGNLVAAFVTTVRTQMRADRVTFADGVESERAAFVAAGFVSGTKNPRVLMRCL